LTLDELQKLAQVGNEEAEKELFRQLSVRYYIITRRYIWDRMDVEEVVQDALAAVADRYKKASYTYTSGFGAWSYGLLKNIICDYNARSKQKRERFAEIGDENSFEQGYETDPLFESRLLKCFNKLNQNNNMYARAINLSYQGYKVADICDRLGITPNNFYSILSRARAIMASCMKKGEKNSE